MRRVQRHVYELLLRMHPAEFRRQFAHEMAMDFEDACRSFGLAPLYWDAIRSLAHQWVAAPASRSSERGAALSLGLLSGHYYMVREGGLTPLQVFRGAIFSVMLFTLFWTTEDSAHGLVANLLRARFYSGSQASAPVRHEIVIRDVTIVDVEDGRLLPHQTVMIVDGRIDKVGREMASAPAGAEVVDGAGKFLIPGMWDMHTHITLAHVDMPMYIANGVLGIRSMGGVEQDVFGWRRELEDGAFLGPRAFVSGPILDGPDGPAQPKSYVVTIANEAAARAEVDSLKAKGADFIKVYDGLSRESYFAIADEAKKIGIPFAGHVPNPVTILEATNAGQRSIEHGIEANGESTAEQALIDRRKTDDFMAEAMKTQNFSLIPEGIARNGKIWMEGFSQERADSLYRTLAKNGTYLCPTLVVSRWMAEGDEMAKVSDARQQYIQPKTLVYWQPSMNMLTRYRTPAYIAWVKQRYAKKMEQIPKEQAAGVQFLTGTDLTVPYIYPGSSVHDEMKLFVTAGLTPLQALQAGTTHPVEFFGLQQSLGSVASGKQGELVLLDANPLADIANVDRIAAVITHGKVLRRAELDSMMAEAAKVAQSTK